MLVELVLVEPEELLEVAELVQEAVLVPDQEQELVQELVVLVVLVEALVVLEAVLEVLVEAELEEVLEEEAVLAVLETVPMVQEGLTEAVKAMVEPRLLGEDLVVLYQEVKLRI